MPAMIVIVECGTKGARPLTTPPKGCNSFVPHAGVAQLARALPCQGRGREFESLHPLHFLPLQTWLRQDLQDGQRWGFRPLCNPPSSCCLCKLGFAKICKTGKAKIRKTGKSSFAPFAIPLRFLGFANLASFLPLQTWLRQDLQDGQRWGFRPLCNSFRFVASWRFR